MTFACPGSPADAAARLEAAIDGRPWNAAGMDGWIRGGGAVLYYRDAITQAIRAALHAGDRV